jgi:hypothetical protein
MATPEQHKAVERAEEAGRRVTELLTQYARSAYYGAVDFTFSFQSGLIQSARHGTEKVLPVTRDR